MEDSPMRMYVGLDVHSKHCAFLIQNDDGKVMGKGQIPTTLAGLRTIKDGYALGKDTKVGLESGAMADFVSKQLRKLGLEPVVINAHEVRLKAHRPSQKTDERDAFEICDGLRRGLYRSIVHVPPEEIAVLRRLLSRRRHFVCVQVGEVQAAKALMRGAGLAASVPKTMKSEKQWTTLIRASPADLHDLLEQHYRLWSNANDQVEALERALDLHQRPFENDVKRLMQVPGVGRIIALTAVAVFSDVARFPSAKHAASYVGLTPSMHQSGTDRKDRGGGITKNGSRELRSVLCEAAHHANSPNNPFHPYFSRLVAKRGLKMAVIAVAHRICRILFSMLRHQRDFDLHRLNVEEGPFEKLTVKRYRLRPAANASA
jgi:transposase